jgi:hypothetical protein
MPGPKEIVHAAHLVEGFRVGVAQHTGGVAVRQAVVGVVDSCW